MAILLMIVGVIIRENFSTGKCLKNKLEKIKGRNIKDKGKKDLKPNLKLII